MHVGGINNFMWPFKVLTWKPLNHPTITQNLKRSIPKRMFVLCKFTFCENHFLIIFLPRERNIQLMAITQFIHVWPACILDYLLNRNSLLNFFFFFLLLIFMFVPHHLKSLSISLLLIVIACRVITKHQHHFLPYTFYFDNDFWWLFEFESENTQWDILKIDAYTENEWNTCTNTRSGWCNCKNALLGISWSFCLHISRSCNIISPCKHPEKYTQHKI